MYSIKSMMPSLLGYPSDTTVLQCSNYGSTGGTFANINGLRSQFSAIPVPPAEVTSDPWLSHLNSVMNGSNSVVLRPVSDDDLALQNLGLSFFPWNQRPYERATFGTNSRDGIVYPFNPWNEATIVTNGITAAKIAGIGVATYFGGTYGWSMYKSRR